MKFIKEMAQFNIQMFLFLLLVTQFLDKFNSKKHDKKTYNSFLGGLYYLVRLLLI